MEAAAILALVQQGTTLITTLAPQLIAMAQAAKAGASSEDAAALDAAIAKLEPMNDQLHDQVQAL